MKRILYTALVVLMATQLKAQTLFTPGSTVGTSSISDKVGIGISTPSSRLDIRHTSTLGSKLTPSNAHLRVGNSAVYMLMDGNELYTSETLYLGSSYSGDFRFRNVDGSSSQDLMALKANGRLGLGTTNPLSMMDINGGATGDVILRLEADTDNSGSEADNPRIEMYQDNRLIYAHLGFNEDTPTTANMFQVSVGSPDGFVRDALIINPYNGYIGLGTMDPKARLSVNGSIYAKEVKIMTDIQHPDYVFEEDYNLKDIKEVERFIKENKHLPNIPSAAEVIENGGLEVGQMQAKLLEKIEELTLYIIEQNKRLEEQQGRIEALEGK
jgi:hypothetical protein